MSKIWEPQSIEIYESWVNAIENEASDKLNEWEFNFVHSIGLQLAKCKQLSEKQATILERIYVENTK